MSEYVKEFKHAKVIAKSKEMLERSGGKEVVDACWSAHPDFIWPGAFIWINEFGVDGAISLDSFEKMKKGASI